MSEATPTTARCSCGFDPRAEKHHRPWCRVFNPPPAPDRLTVGTITSDALDALQLRAARMEHATKQAAELAVRLEDAERDAEQHARNTETVARERESYRQAWKEAQRMRAKAEQRAEAASRLGTQYMTAAELAEAAIARVHAAVEQLCVDPHPGHDHVCPDDVSKAVLAALDEPPTPAAAELEKTARVFAALHQSAEQDVSRVIDLYERWVKAGPPPIGTSVSRWWDDRLVELHDAIRAPDEATEPIVDRPFRSHRPKPAAPYECAHGHAWKPRTPCAECLAERERPHPAEPVSAVLDPDRPKTRYRVCRRCTQATAEPVHRAAACACTYGQRCPNCRD